MRTELSEDEDLIFFFFLVAGSVDPLRFLCTESTFWGGGKCLLNADKQKNELHRL